MQNKLIIFVGSSSEAKEYDSVICSYLKELGAEVKHWREIPVFNESFFDSLLRISLGIEAALIIATPDDEIDYRGDKRFTPRDNIIFEFGFFIGKLGKDRTGLVVVKDKEKEELRLPTDLSGIFTISYFTDGVDELKGSLRKWYGFIKSNISDNLDDLKSTIKKEIDDWSKENSRKLENNRNGEIPKPIYYNISSKIISKIKNGGYITVTNLLSLDEWRDDNFNESYLQVEAAQIRKYDIKVTRYFIGNIDDFQTMEVRAKLDEHIKNGVNVRTVIFDKDSPKSKRFRRDIGLYGTTPECVLEYHYGKMVSMPVFSCEYSQINEIKGFLSRIKRLSAPWRLKDEYELIRERSCGGWNKIYVETDDNSDGYVWQNEPCPMLMKNKALIKKTVYNLLKKEQITPPIRIAELGCGDGRNLGFLFNMFDSIDMVHNRLEIVGVDICKHALYQCSKHLVEYTKREYPNFRLIEADITRNTLLPANSVDFIICVDVFTHIFFKDVAGALKEWQRILSPTGCLLMNVYSHLDETFEDCKNYGEKAKGDVEGYWYQNTYFHYYKTDELKRLLLNSGFIIPEKFSMQSWEDPPHKEYRPKKHKHESFIIVARKQ